MKFCTYFRSMWRYIFFLGLVCVVGTSSAQIQKHFKIERSNRHKSVTLNYASCSGVCYISSGESDEPITVYSDRDIDEFNHTFNKITYNNNLEINLNLESKNKQTFSQSISNKVFSTNRLEDNLWKVYLAEDLPYDLNFVFGVGSAFIDLSGLNINNFSVRTGSADVNIGYLTHIPNPVVMDSFNIKVDLGNVIVRKLYLSRAKHIYAEVGFGSMQLDLAEPPTVPSNVYASVGAGTLEILIPKNDCSIIVKIKDSMLCNVQLTKSFKLISENVYVNEAYDESAVNQLAFEIDVSFGNIIIKEKK